MNTATIQTETTTEIYVGDGVYIDLPTLPYLNQVNLLNKSTKTRPPQDYMWEEYKPHYFKYRNDALNDVINMSCNEFLNKYSLKQFTNITNEMEDERIGSSNRKQCKELMRSLEDHYITLRESKRHFEIFSMSYNRFINNVVQFDLEDTNHFSESSKFYRVFNDVHNVLITEHKELVNKMYKTILNNENTFTITTREVEIYIGDGVYIEHICLPDEIQFAIKNRLDMNIITNSNQFYSYPLNSMEKINTLEDVKYNQSIHSLKNIITDDYEQNPERTVKQLRDIAKSNRIKLTKCTTKQQILTQIYNSWKLGSSVIIR